MSSLSFLSVYLIGVSLTLLLTAVSEAQYYEDSTPAPDYDSDYNATFDYSFYSNASTDDLEKFLKGSEGFIDPEEGEEEEEEVTVTTATTRGTTERVGVDVYSAASLPVHLDVRMLVWTLMILISLNIQQLQHTL